MKDKITLRLVLMLLLGIVGYYIVFQGFYNLMMYQSMYPYEDIPDMLTGVTLNFVPTFLQSVFIAMVVFWPSRERNIERKIAIDALLVTAMLVAFNLAFPPVMKILGFPQWSGVNWGGSAFNAIFVFLGMETTFYVLSFKQSLRETETQKRLALQYRYDALKAQVNPHFLFNSLNILYSLVSIDQQRSKEFVLALSHMYRYVMSQQNQDTVSLRDELDFLHNYVGVLEMRYRDQFSMVVEGEEHIGDQSIVPFTMQLLIENVTKHNVISTQYPMTVTVVITDEHVTVSNPIRERPSESPSHVGLNYITELYQSHGKQFSVDNDGKTFTATVPFI